MYHDDVSFEIHAPQTKTLDGGTKDEIRISNEALFKDVSTRFGPRTFEKVHRQSGLHLLFLLSKSSFGETDIVNSLTINGESLGTQWGA